MKVRNFITSIAGNNVDVCPPLISMEMHIGKVSEGIINSIISPGDITILNSKIYNLWSPTTCEGLYLASEKKRQIRYCSSYANSPAGETFFVYMYVFTKYTREG